MNFNIISINVKQQKILLVLFAILLNFNTVFNDYVLDDSIVISENTSVQMGIQGIPKILFEGYFKGYKKLENLEFSGGRYRPFALITFAIEYQFFGANPFISHLINILLFALLIFLLFHFLKTYLFVNGHKYFAFITCLLFAAHPIHTEVIANVKSRDEIITFILLITSSISLIKYYELKKIYWFIIGFFSFFLALLTRESAITFVALLPLTLYFFFNKSVGQVFRLSIPLVIVSICYLLLRYSIVDIHNHTSDDISNSPFLYATISEAFATKVFLIVKYISLLLFPHPLSFEYGYNQITYLSMSSYTFIASLLLLLFLVVIAFIELKEKSLLSFCILYFVITISVVSNFIIDIGTPLSERLLFQPSLAICIVIAKYFYELKIKSKLLANSAIIVVLLLFSLKTYSRNLTWKNYDTLVLTDIISSPNSVRLNQFAMNIYLSKSIIENNTQIKNAYLHKGAYYGENIIRIYPKATSIYMTLGYTYFNLLDYNKASFIWKEACKLEASKADSVKAGEILSDELYKMANGFYEQNKIGDAINCYKKSIEFNKNNIEAWYNLGGNYFLNNDSVNGKESWRILLNLAPNHPLDKGEFVVK